MVSYMSCNTNYNGNNLGVVMARFKTRLSRDRTEEHVIYWAIEQINYQKELSQLVGLDHSVPQEEKRLIFQGIADLLVTYVVLLKPFAHDELELLEWVEEFIKDHAISEEAFTYRRMN